jgi:hypothetical protein
MVKSIRNFFVWLIKSLAENITWQDKIRDEIIKMKRQDSYSEDNLQLEYFRNLNMFLCEAMRMYEYRNTVVIRQIVGVHSVQER